MHQADKLSLNYEARPENVPEARAAVADLGEALGMEEPALGDLKTIVTEACTNVVRHAYPEGEGRFEVEASPEEGELEIVVRDFGAGLRPTLHRQETSMRMGLGLISQLSSSFEIGAGNQGGTVVRMRMPLSG
ncbi:MAG TPA: ATP-binding protein [Solirubrobacterales bacterium]|jgi:anti-sigma regulatory factor (Ser/Thr protein kinase)|nr:ATP-binding protein [Solirubrobacterales bacterium]